MVHEFKPNIVSHQITELKHSKVVLFTVHDHGVHHIFEAGKYGFYKNEKVTNIEYSVYGIEITTDHQIYFLANTPYTITLDK